MNKRYIIIIISVLFLLAVVGGVSYSYFVYNKDIGDISLTTGEISIDFSGVNGNQTFSNIIPLTDADGKSSSSYFDFTVDATVDTERIYYEIYLLPDSENTLDTDYLKVYLTDQSNNELKGVTIYNNLGDSEIENGKVIYKGIIEVNQNGATRNESNDFRLRLWLDESFSGQTSKVFDFDIYLYAKNIDAEFELPYGANLIRKAIEEKEAAGGSCSTITWTDTEDNVVYLSGTNDCIDMNYVWYSGKLWRITAIYPDGSMKLLSNDNITVLPWGSNVVFDGSWIYQWLNEDFYDTLYGREIIIKNALWNYTTDSSSTPRRPESLSNQKTVTTTVGLLNTYEYYNSYRLLSDYESGYLNIGYNYWFLTPRSSTEIWRSSGTGLLNYNNATGYSSGVRPAIIINSGLEFTGNGTKLSPFKIVGDKALSTNNSTLINSRVSGEYVNFSGDLYRIVDIENGITKLVRVDYLENSGTVVNKLFASSQVYGKSTNTSSDDYVDYYLNNTWYNSIGSTYKTMMVDGLYYLGSYNSNSNYKGVLCNDASLDSVTTSNCTKYTSSDIDKTFVGKVGLLRVGEMFSAQMGDGYASSSNTWLITPYQSTMVCFLYGYQNVGSASPTSGSNSIRPTITLKSSVIITSGIGMKNSPFEISE